MIGKMLGGTIKAVWWLLQAAWGHPVLRLVILSSIGIIWFLPLTWWPSAVIPGNHAYTVAGIVVVGVAEIWWMLKADTVHHLYPRPWLMSVLRVQGNVKVLV